MGLHTSPEILKIFRRYQVQHQRILVLGRNRPGRSGIHDRSLGQEATYDHTPLRTLFRFA